jgi:hemerythrin
MRKLNVKKVTSGVYWVDAPEAGVRMLCGSPPDAIKHLVRRGFIGQTQKNGILFETGPNAILLSDVQVQGGVFSNMSEFPVSQMLYKQGMIIPGHPNNTGAKPILAGSREQVFSQLHYIYRGNYGFVTEEEVMGAGENADSARVIMNMKRAFAFGSIVKATELVETRVVEAGAVEVKGGLFVRRAAMNVFEISLDNDAVTIDLNLGPAEEYPSPYALGFHRPRKKKFAVIHAGEGNGFDPYRPSMMSVISADGRYYLVDAGPNIVQILAALGIGINEVAGIFHTHAHDDHFAGLTSLMRSDHRIKYFATRLVRASVSKKLSALLSIDEDMFKDYFDVVDLNAGEWNRVGSFEVKPIFSPHPVETSAYAFRSAAAGGFKTYSHLADVTSLYHLRRMISSDPSAPGISSELYESVCREYFEPANIKKIDAGGGLIHGDADDFRNDGSGKILIAHTAGPLTRRQKEVGARATFGETDVLVEADADYLRLAAESYLTALFQKGEGVPRELVNSEIVHMTPGTVLLEAGKVAETVYLVLSGNVESSGPARTASKLIYAGSFIGEMSSLFSEPSSRTYASYGYSAVLAMPAELYAACARRHGLERDMRQRNEAKKALRETHLFGEGVSYDVLDRVAASAKRKSYPEGIMEPSAGSGAGERAVSIVINGRLECLLGDEPLETLTVGGFFGEDEAVFSSAKLFTVRATEPVELYEIPASVLREIPIVLWKLFEAAERRRRLAIKPVNSPGSFEWKSEFDTGVSLIDEHHRALFKICDECARGLNGASGVKAALKKAVQSLEDYARYHFDAEEALMEASVYPEIEAHRAMHDRLLARLVEKKSELESTGYGSDAGLVEFLSNEWMTGHVLNEDRAFGIFHNNTLKR